MPDPRDHFLPESVAIADEVCGKVLETFKIGLAKAAQHGRANDCTGLMLTQYTIASMAILIMAASETVALQSRVMGVNQSVDEKLLICIDLVNSFRDDLLKNAQRHIVDTERLRAEIIASGKVPTADEVDAVLAKTINRQ